MVETQEVFCHRGDNLREDKWTVKINGPCLVVEKGTMAPQQSSGDLISFNTGTKVINDQALFYIGNLIATLEGNIYHLCLLQLRRERSGRGRAQNFPSSKPMVLEHYHFLEAVVGSLQPAVSGLLAA